VRVKCIIHRWCGNEVGEKTQAGMGNGFQYTGRLWRGVMRVKMKGVRGAAARPLQAAVWGCGTAGGGTRRGR